MRIMKIAYRTFALALTAAVALAAFARAADEALPPGAKLVKIEAQPANVTLSNPFRYAQLVLTGVTETGDRLDVTRLAKLDKPLDAVKVSPAGLVRPTAD